MQNLLIIIHIIGSTTTKGYTNQIFCQVAYITKFLHLSKTSPLSLTILAVPVLGPSVLLIRGCPSKVLFFTIMIQPKISDIFYKAESPSLEMLIGKFAAPRK